MIRLAQTDPSHFMTPMNLKAQTVSSIHQHAADQFPMLRQIRRDLHQHPELSRYESWTASYLAAKLARLGLEVESGVGGHGLVANLITDPSKPTVALRVDIDALPIQEINDVPYRSKIPGQMHACGHDVHSAIGIGTAAVCVSLAEALPGNIRFIFQPEEEEITGALRMIRDGVLDNPVPKAILGLHVAPIPAGLVAWTDDLFLAGFNHFLCTITPKEGFDIPIHHLDSVAKRCCQKIRGFNKWHLPETWDGMQSFWQKMQEGPQDLRHFIIYDATPNQDDPMAWHGQFGVGIKAANHHLRRTAVGRIKATLNTLCRLSHTNYRFEPVGSMIDMRNDFHLVQSTQPALAQQIGSENTIQLQAAFPFNCEDFAYYTKRIPGAMYWLGAADPDNNKFAMLHTPNFDVDERCIQTGTMAMSALLFSALQDQ